jgi:hypothetical protein
MLVEFKAPTLYQRQDNAKNVALTVSGKVYALPLKAAIVPRVTAPQTVFDLGELGKAEERALTVSVTKQTGQNWAPRVTAQPDGVETRLRLAEANQFELSIRVTATAMLAGTWSQETVIVSLGDDWELPIELSGSRKSDIVVEPPMMNFGMVPAGQNKSVSTVINHKTLGDKFKITGLQNSAKTLKVDLRQRTHGQYVLTATWNGNKEIEGKAQKMSLILETNDLEQKQVMITLLGMTPKISTGCCDNK